MPVSGASPTTTNSNQAVRTHRTTETTRPRNTISFSVTPVLGVSTSTTTSTNLQPNWNQIGTKLQPTLIFMDLFGSPSNCQVENNASERGSKKNSQTISLLNLCTLICYLLGWLPCSGRFVRCRKRGTSFFVFCELSSSVLPPWRHFLGGARDTFLSKSRKRSPC